MWGNTGIGKAFTVPDPATKAIATRILLHKEAMPLPGSGHSTLVSRG